MPPQTTLSGVYNSNAGAIPLGSSSSPISTPPSVTPSSPVVPSIFKKTTPVVSPSPSSKIFTSTPTPQLDYSKYTNPTTGKPYTPQEYADSIASKVSGGNVPNYAAKVINNPNMSTNDLISTATDLNNTRNDIATGTTDPYGVGPKSGIQYTPEELKAIESAQAGIYDPAIKDVMAKLDTQQKADTAAAAEKQKQADMVTQTNLDIQKWRATTGSKSASGNNFTNTQEANGASAAGMTLSDFSKLDPDIKNFYINPPTIYDPTAGTSGKNVSVLDNYKQDVAAIKDGSKTVQEVTDDINSGAGLPTAVKALLINQLPTDSTSTAAKSGFWEGLKNWVEGN